MLLHDRPRRSDIYLPVGIVDMVDLNQQVPGAKQDICIWRDKRPSTRYCGSVHGKPTPVLPSYQPSGVADLSLCRQCPVTPNPPSALKNIRSAAGSGTACEARTARCLAPLPDPRGPLSSIGRRNYCNAGGVVLFPDHTTLRYADDAGVSVLLSR